MILVALPVPPICWACRDTSFFSSSCEDPQFSSIQNCVIPITHCYTNTHTHAIRSPSGGEASIVPGVFFLSQSNRTVAPASICLPHWSKQHGQEETQRLAYVNRCKTKTLLLYCNTSEGPFMKQAPGISNIIKPYNSIHHLIGCSLVWIK